ncbi:MAG: helix-turn-helix domain-containing protein [Synergistaceae bacterium]|nr:helix-turn-helix domain-containing protein [Synergistaceae bacterium]
MDKIFIPDEPESGEKFNSTESMTRIIGMNLRRARLRRGFSLDEVSSRSNVSKSMLSDIERGRKCPTIAVLYKICEGIHVSLPSLMKSPDKFVEVIKNEELVPHGGVELQYMFRYDINTSMEIHKLAIAPNSEISAEPHGEKIWEYIMVAEGVFTLVLDDDVYEVEKGEAIRFLANRKHIYANRTDSNLLAYNIVYYGG